MADQPGASEAETAALAKFLSFLSHDLRGGLNGALLMLEVIRRQSSKNVTVAEVSEDLDVARKSILETVDLMDRFVLAERLRIGRVNLKMEAVQIGPLLQEIWQNYRDIAGERDAAIQVSCEPELVAEVDRALLHRILSGLLSNAVKYCRGKPIDVRALAAPAAASDASVRIEIVDCGLGFKPEVQAALDAPLVVGEHYDRKKGGMGIYIARRAARLMNIDLRFQPNVGGGTLVTLELPQIVSATTR